MDVPTAPNHSFSEFVRAMAADDPLGPDFSGIRAHATLEIHMKECTERQAELRANFVMLHGRLDGMQKSFEERMSARDVSIDKRMTAISNRMWGAAVGVIAASVGALCVVVFHLLTKAPH